MGNLFIGGRFLLCQTVTTTGTIYDKPNQAIERSTKPCSSGGKSCCCRPVGRTSLFSSPLKTREDQVSASGISCNGHSPDPSTVCTWPMDIAHMGAGRTHRRLAYSADICHLRGADQGAQTTSLPETETAAPDTSHNPSTDRTHQSSNGIDCTPSARNVDIGMKVGSTDGDTARNTRDASADVEQ
jgi:hypothetical protein